MLRLIVFMIICTPSVLLAEEFSGQVQRRGIGRRAVVSIAKNEKLTVLCKSKNTTLISRLMRMDVKVMGKQNAKNKCFLPESFDVLTLINGGRATTGILKKKAKDYYIKKDKDEFYLQDPPEGLRELLNEKVIVELHPVTGKQGKLRQRIGSYMRWPKL